MRKVLIGAVALVVLALGSTALAGSAGVTINSAGFSPANVSVQTGDSVSWTNSDTVAHQVSVSNSTCKLDLQPSQSSSCAFPTAGTFNYSDPTASGGGFNGTVTVAQNSRAVTLSASVSSKAPGEQVTVISRPAGLPEARRTVTTTTGGAWTLGVQPRVKTSYQASYDTVSSSAVTVQIRPRITLQKVGRHQYLIVVLAARSMAGKQVNITRFIPGRGYV